MKNGSFILLKNLLLSTSRLNEFKHCDDKKKRNKIIWTAVGSVLLYAMLMFYSVGMCIGYGQYGMIDSAPVMCAIVISALSFVFTFFKTNGYLFNFKEYDMLMSLPFKESTVAACKFLYMYIKSLPWYLSISVAMMAGYGYFARPSFTVYVLWLFLSLILPVVPMLIAAFLGFLIAKVSSGFKKTKIIQTALSFAFVVFCFAIRFIIEDIFKNDKVESTLSKTNDITSGIAKYYIPAGWFAKAVTKPDILSALLLIAVSAVLFFAVFMLVGRSYRNVNSALKSNAVKSNYRMTGQKTRSVLNAIAFKEFRRMTGSTTYMVNAAIGELLALIISVITLVMGPDKLISFVLRGAPVDSVMLRPAIPVIVYFLIGMFATTACSPSLEGKNYWIVRSLPIELKTVYQGKMLFNMYLTVPVMLFSTVCFCIAAKASVTETVLYIVLGFVLCCFSTAWGCVCGVKHLKLDWENEVEVIKQGSAVTIYMLPNMFVSMALCVLVVYLGTKINPLFITAGLFVLSGTLAALCCRRVMILAKRG
ncbi:MAG: hypothetical protein IJS90_08280 [Clostridia bacterium]|nr:hypothetical protein [Clostridia bacterium]